MAVRWESGDGRFAMTRVDASDHDWSPPDGWDKRPDQIPVAVWSWQGKEPPSSESGRRKTAIVSWEDGP